MASKNFTPTQWRVVERIGDIIIPGDEALPAFYACGFYHHVDRLADSMQKSDLSLLKLLLALLRFMPDFVIRFILFVASKESLGYDAAIRTELEQADDLPDLVEAANPLN